MAVMYDVVHGFRRIFLVGYIRGRRTLSCACCLSISSFDSKLFDIFFCSMDGKTKKTTKLFIVCLFIRHIVNNLCILGQNN
jgi:hypothetical protein